MFPAHLHIRLIAKGLSLSHISRSPVDWELHRNMGLKPGYTLDMRTVDWISTFYCSTFQGDTARIRWMNESRKSVVQVESGIKCMM